MMNKMVNAEMPKNGQGQRAKRQSEYWHHARRFTDRNSEHRYANAKPAYLCAAKQQGGSHEPLTPKASRVGGGPVLRRCNQNAV